MLRSISCQRLGICGLWYKTFLALTVMINFRKVIRYDKFQKSDPLKSQNCILSDGKTDHQKNTVIAGGGNLKSYTKRNNKSN